VPMPRAICAKVSLPTGPSRALVPAGQPLLALPVLRQSA
jgi:hypothetical protein